MGFENTIVNLAIILGLVVLLVVVFVLHQFVLAKRREKNGETGKSEKKPTTILDEKEDKKKCEICYGTIDDDSIAVCKCNRIFHNACAKPTGACPFCNTKYEDMMVRDPEKTRCPKCGRFIKGNICHNCNIVISSIDDTFVCKCGNVIDYDKPVCKVCGAVYEPVVTMKERNQKT